MDYKIYKMLYYSYSNAAMPTTPLFVNSQMLTSLVGGFNPIEKYWSKRESSPNRGGNETYLKLPPSFLSLPFYDGMVQDPPPGVMINCIHNQTFKGLPNCSLEYHYAGQPSCPKNGFAASSFFRDLGSVLFLELGPKNPSS